MFPGMLVPPDGMYDVVALLPDTVGRRLQSIPSSPLNEPEREGINCTGADAPALLVDAKEAARLCSISRAGWFRLCSSGRTPRPIRLGARVLWLIDELRRWLEAGAPPRDRWEQIKEPRRDIRGN